MQNCTESFFQWVKFFLNSHRDNKEYVLPIFEKFSYFCTFYLIMIFTMLLYVQEKNYSIEYVVYSLIKNVIFHSCFQVLEKYAYQGSIYAFHIPLKYLCLYLPVSKHIWGSNSFIHNHNTFFKIYCIKHTMQFYN